MSWADQPDAGHICLLGAEGSLSGTDLVKLAERLRGLAAQGVLRVVVDLRRVEDWDTRGLGCLAEAVSFRSSRGGLTAWITPDRHLRRAVHEAGAADLFDFYDDLSLEEGLHQHPLSVGKKHVQVWAPRSVAEA